MSIQSNDFAADLLLNGNVRHLAWSFRAVETVVDLAPIV
jgi:hypothetical protein